jgi:hypothetical protein
MGEKKRRTPIDISDLIEVNFTEDDDFLRIKETLTRIGVSSRKDKTLFQSCHILHKRGKYYIVHFKELFALDGKFTDISDNDIARRNTIVNLLAEWGLLSIANVESTKSPVVPINQIKILAFKDKDAWELVTKYNIGGRRNES